MPAHRRLVGAPARVHDLRRGRLLRQLAEQARDGALPRDRPPDHPLARARRELVLVLRGRGRVRARHVAPRRLAGAAAGGRQRPRAARRSRSRRRASSGRTPALRGDADADRGDRQAEVGRDEQARERLAAVIGRRDPVDHRERAHDHEPDADPAGDRGDDEDATAPSAESPSITSARPASSHGEADQHRAAAQQPVQDELRAGRAREEHEDDDPGGRVVRARAARGRGTTGRARRRGRASANAANIASAAERNSARISAGTASRWTRSGGRCRFATVSGTSSTATVASASSTR